MCWRFADRANSNPFERFAAQSLTDAGAEYVRPIAAAHEVALRRLSSTGLLLDRLRQERPGRPRAGHPAGGRGGAQPPRVSGAPSRHGLVPGDLRPLHGAVRARRHVGADRFRRRRRGPAESLRVPERLHLHRGRDGVPRRRVGRAHPFRRGRGAPARPSASTTTSTATPAAACSPSRRRCLRPRRSPSMGRLPATMRAPPMRCVSPWCSPRRRSARASASSARSRPCASASSVAPRSHRSSSAGSPSRW